MWLALEFDGPAHARDLQQAREALSQAQGAVAAHPGDDEHRKRAEEATKRFQQVRDEWSRLVAIDADLDADALRARHPDRTRVAIVRGRVRPSWRYREPYASGRGEWRGHIEAVAVDPVAHVELAQALFDEADDLDNPMVVHEGTDDAGRAWAGGTITTAGGYYLDVIAVPDGDAVVPVINQLARRFEIGVGNIMWGNDFPHPEGTWPHTRESLVRELTCIREKHSRKQITTWSPLDMPQRLWERLVTSSGIAAATPWAPPAAARAA